MEGEGVSEPAAPWKSFTWMLRDSTAESSPSRPVPGPVKWLTPSNGFLEIVQLPRAPWEPSRSPLCPTQFMSYGADHRGRWLNAP